MYVAVIAYNDHDSVHHTTDKIISFYFSRQSLFQEFSIKDMHNGTALKL